VKLVSKRVVEDSGARPLSFQSQPLQQLLLESSCCRQHCRPPPICQQALSGSHGVLQCQHPHDKPLQVPQSQARQELDQAGRYAVQRQVLAQAAADDQLNQAAQALPSRCCSGRQSVMLLPPLLLLPASTPHCSTSSLNAHPASWAAGELAPAAA